LDTPQKISAALIASCTFDLKMFKLQKKEHQNFQKDKYFASKIQFPCCILAAKKFFPQKKNHQHP